VWSCPGGGGGLSTDWGELPTIDKREGGEKRLVVSAWCRRCGGVRRRFYICRHSDVSILWWRKLQRHSGPTKYPDKAQPWAHSRNMYSVWAAASLIVQEYIYVPTPHGCVRSF